MIFRNREAIEQTDRQIAGLLHSRKVMSQRIGRLKAELGIPYTDLRQESAVIGRYTEALGPYGASLAQDILRLSKGQ